MYRKKYRIHRVQYYPRFQVSTGALEIYALRMKGDECSPNAPPVAGSRSLGSEAQLGDLLQTSLLSSLK